MHPPQHMRMLTHRLRLFFCMTNSAVFMFSVCRRIVRTRSGTADTIAAFTSSTCFMVMRFLDDRPNTIGAGGALRCRCLGCFPAPAPAPAEPSLLSPLPSTTSAAMVTRRLGADVGGVKCSVASPGARTRVLEGLPCAPSRPPPADRRAPRGADGARFLSWTPAPSSAGAAAAGLDDMPPLTPALSP